MASGRVQSKPLRLTSLSRLSILAVRLRFQAEGTWMGKARLPALLLSPALLVSSFLVQHARSEVRHMQLLSPENGWAATARNLFLTTDAGKAWCDVTPRMPEGSEISSVFFLDPQNGWLLLARADKQSEQPQFYLASTINAGADWSIAPVPISGIDPASTTLTGSGSVSFADRAHGWLNLHVASGAAFSLGILFVTSDGGATWHRAASGAGGYVRLVTPSDGWALSLHQDELYVTHDGARSWQPVSVSAPNQTGGAIYPTYGLPTFLDSKHCLLPVTYSGGEGVGSSLTLFVSNDSGRTWTPQVIVGGLTKSSIGEMVPTAAVDSTLLSASVSHDTLTLRMNPFGGPEVKRQAKVFSQAEAVFLLSFATKDVGWSLTSAGLLLTEDGGKSWSDITPGSTTRKDSATVPVSLLNFYIASDPTGDA